MKRKIIIGLLLLVVTVFAICIITLSHKKTLSKIRQNQTNQENEAIADSVRSMSPVEQWGTISADFDSIAKLQNR